MGRPKIARKSTWVDMTAFCDVAFLLLAFFILATKTKPPEAITVVTPKSVSTKPVEEVDQVQITITADNKVFMSLSEESRREEVIRELGKISGVPFDDADLAKAKKAEFFGTPISQVKSYLNLPTEQRRGDLLPGIPVLDTANNELKTWMTAVNNVFFGAKLNLIVKGDNEANYPAFKSVIDAFKQYDTFLKFKIHTDKESVPAGSELYKANAKTAANKAAE